MNTILHPEKEAVVHPQHYGGGDDPYEHIKVVQAWGLNYELGNATKYICRAGKKHDNVLEDLRKARFYLDYEIRKLERAQCTTPPSTPTKDPLRDVPLPLGITERGEGQS